MLTKTFHKAQFSRTSIFARSWLNGKVRSTFTEDFRLQFYPQIHYMQ